MKTLWYYIACLTAACCVAVSAKASSEFVNGSKIKVMTAANRATEGNDDMVVFREGTAEGQPKAEMVKLKITNEFKPQPREEYKLSKPIYKWDGKEGGLSHDEKGKEEMEFTTTEKSWGKEFKIKGSIEYKDIPLDPKNKEELPNQEGPAKADIKAVSPVVKVKSVTFRHGKENSSLPVAEDVKGKLIPTPEYQADAGDKETAVLYAAESTPVIQVCFDVKPDGLKMADVEIKGEVGKGKKSVLKALTMEEAEGQSFDSNSKIPFKAAKLEKKVDMGKVSHEFTITYKGVQLAKKPDYSLGNAYVVLQEPVGNWTKKTPWKKVLQFFVKDCGVKGVEKEHDLICSMRSRLSQEKYPKNSKGKVLPNLREKTAMLSNYLNNEIKETNCSDVATLLALGSSLHGVSLEMHICNPFLGISYHSYNFWEGKVYDVRFQEGDGRFNEKEFYDRIGQGNNSVDSGKHFVMLDTVIYKNYEGFPDPIAVPEGNPFKWIVPFEYIQKQTEKTGRDNLRTDIHKEKVYTVVSEGNYFFLENYDVHNITLK